MSKRKVVMVLFFLPLTWWVAPSGNRLEARPLPLPLRVQHGAVEAETCSGTVLETMASGGYTYVRVDCGAQEVWAAGPLTPLQKGDEVSFSLASAMREFRSPTLARTFDTIYFVPAFQSPRSLAASAATHGTNESSDTPTELDFSELEKPQGGWTIAEIFARRQELSGQRVLVRGKVVKYNAGILGKNWLHLQDGTGESGSNDLTVVTEAEASVGETVLVQGGLTLDKDFGAGYRYEVILEDATVTIE